MGHCSRWGIPAKSVTVSQPVPLQGPPARGRALAAAMPDGEVTSVSTTDPHESFGEHVHHTTQKHLDQLHHYRDQRRHSVSAGGLASGIPGKRGLQHHGSKAAKLQTHKDHIRSAKDKKDFRSRLFVLLNMPESEGCGAARIFNLIMNLVVAFSIIVFMLNTTPGFMGLCPQRYRIIPATVSDTPCNKEQEARWMLNHKSVPASECCVQQYDWGIYELVFTMIFTVELALRVYAEGSCGEFFIVIDALAIVPFYVSLFLDNISVLTLLASVRMLRLLKVVRHFDGTLIFVRAIRKSFKALTVPALFTVIMALVFASLLYYIEKAGAEGQGLDQVGSFSSEADVAAFRSIPEAVWFMFATFTTVGYGDVSPNTNTGRLLVSICMIIGVLLMAMPLAIVGSNFVQVWDDREKVTAVEKLKDALFRHKKDPQTVEEVFHAIDKDGSETLSYQGLRLGLKDLDVLKDITNKKLTKIWAALDPDGNGEIELHDFQSVLFGDRDLEDDEDFITDMDDDGDEELDAQADAHALQLELSHPATRRDLSSAIESQTRDFELRMADLSAKLEALMS